MSSLNITTSMDIWCYVNFNTSNTYSHQARHTRDDIQYCFNKVTYTSGYTWTSPQHIYIKYIYMQLPITEKSITNRYQTLSTWYFFLNTWNWKDSKEMCWICIIYIIFMFLNHFTLFPLLISLVSTKKVHFLDFQK